MIQNPEHPVQSVQHARGEPEQHIPGNPLAGLNWDDLRLFLAVADLGSLRAAAAAAGVAVNTVRNRMVRLERQSGQVLLIRGPDGVRPSPAGARLQQVALSMAGAARFDTASGAAEAAYLRQPNELRIGASEALGSGWLTPRLLDLQARLGGLTVNLQCDNDLETNRHDDLDIAIVWKMPVDPRLIVSRLATIHFLPFASREYLAEHGIPRTPDDLLHHRFIEQVSPGVKSDLLNHLVGSSRPPGFVPVRSNSSLAIFWTVANNGGIAFMPTFAPVAVPRLVPIDLPFQLRFDIFYCFHAEARASAAVMTGVEWLKACFDPAVYPWFRADFVHPREFPHANVRDVSPLFTDLA